MPSKFKTIDTRDIAILFDFSLVTLTRRGSASSSPSQGYASHLGLSYGYTDWTTFDGGRSQYSRIKVAIFARNELGEQIPGTSNLKN